MDRPEPRSDCSRCAALCCIAYPSEISPGFNAQKEAGEACPNLDNCGQCAIYEVREERGFSGCDAYECFGAGQHVVEQLYKSRDWRDDPAILAPMLATFLNVRKACELLYLVDYARKQTQEVAHLDAISNAENVLLDITKRRERAKDSAEMAKVERDLRKLFSQLDQKPKAKTPA